VRVLVCVLAVAVLLVPGAGATPAGLKLLLREDDRLALVYVDRVTPFRQPLRPAPYRRLAFSGDGRLISIGGDVVGRIRLPTETLTWAPTGERAAYTTSEGAVVVWTPHGKRRIEPKGWAARPFLPGLAWSRGGALAIVRGHEVWLWRDGEARRLVGPVAGVPVLDAFTDDGRLLWWEWPNSGSIAADGVALYADSARLGSTLMYRDYAAACGRHLAFAAGGDRSSDHGKSIVFDGRDVSHDASRSWVSPSCTAAGPTVVAAAGRDLGICCHVHTEHRAIWELLPTRRLLTHPPAGWTDESPRVFANGDVLFVRTRLTSLKTADTYHDTERGRVMLLSHGRLRRVGEIGYRNVDELKLYLGPYYDHYDFSQFLAVWP
jgi:hypothetical protein